VIEPAQDVAESIDDYAENVEQYERHYACDPEDHQQHGMNHAHDADSKREGIVSEEAHSPSEQYPGFFIGLLFVRLIHFANSLE
jgi:hypothetical protein